MSIEYPTHDPGPSDYSDVVIIDGEIRSADDVHEDHTDSDEELPYSLREKQQPALEITGDAVSVDLGLRATYLLACLDDLDFADSLTVDLKNKNVKSLHEHGGSTKVKQTIHATKQRAMERLWTAGGYRSLLENGVPFPNVRDEFVIQKYFFRDKYSGQDNQANRDELRATLTREPEVQTSPNSQKLDDHESEREARIEALMDKRGYSRDDAEREVGP